MKPDAAKGVLEHQLHGLGLRLDSLSPNECLDSMVSFYRDTRAEACDLDADGDMLLFQWGTFDWGHGRHFEFDITRQFIVGAGEDDDMSQLNFTVRFPPEPDLVATGAANRWCHSPSAIDEWAAFVRGTRAFHLVGRRRDGVAELVYGGV